MALLKSARDDLEELRAWRSKRFRVLVCISDSDESYEGLRFAAEIGRSDETDIILAYVRPTDQGLRSGGLQIRVARENMMDWGLELPGIQHLKRGFDILVESGHQATEWDRTHAHSDVWGDPLGDNKIEYRHDSGKSIVLKLKTAPDVVSGILDQYELGPYNLMTLGAPSRWQGEIRSFWDAGVVQKVAMLSPCSVLVAREPGSGRGWLLCADGSEQCYDSLRRAAVLAHHCGRPITLFSVARDHEGKARAEDVVEKAAEMVAGLGLQVARTAIGVGDPVDQILGTAAGHDLVVVSDSGKSRLKRFLVGSVAFAVMGRAKISVLNVR